MNGRMRMMLLPCSFEQVVLGQLQPISRVLMPVQVQRQQVQELELQFADELAELQQQQMQGGLF
jgi:hypothetical protein